MAKSCHNLAGSEAVTQVFVRRDAYEIEEGGSKSR